MRMIVGMILKGHTILIVQSTSCYRRSCAFIANYSRLAKNDSFDPINVVTLRRTGLEL